MRAFLASILASVVVLSGCGTEDRNGETRSTLGVSAAASLRASFERIADRFEADNDGVDVELSFGGSSDLVAQIREGAPADVFASADLANMDKLAEEGLTGQEPRIFATNTLQIAVAPDNPLGIGALADLTGGDVNLVTCAPAVPCGAATLEAAAAAGVELSPVSEEQSVTDVLAKVTSGEADAGLVYVTDVIAADGAVLGIDFAEAAEAVSSYPITTVAGSDVGSLAEEFVALVLGADGQAILRDAGFGEP